jgi:hypothetical protein
MNITKGTWKIDGDLDNLSVIVEDHNTDTVRRICHVACWNHQLPHYSESDANAKLIAAAPDLFETLLTISKEGNLPYELHMQVLSVLVKAAV